MKIQEYNHIHMYYITGDYFTAGSESRLYVQLQTPVLLMNFLSHIYM